MKISNAEFVISAVKGSQYPGDGLPEVALIGRSNAGKSSLINTLVNRRHLAKTSSEPGKTRTINFYRINNGFYLVDLPGFGYANVPFEEKKAWERMIGEYLEERESLCGVLIILDPRRDPGESEDHLYRWVESLDVRAITVFTKTDKLSKNRLSSRVASIKKAVHMDSPVLFSSLTGEGRIQLLKKIQELIGSTACPGV